MQETDESRTPRCPSCREALYVEDGTALLRVAGLALLVVAGALALWQSQSPAELHWAGAAAAALAGLALMRRRLYYRCPACGARFRLLPPRRSRGRWRAQSSGPSGSAGASEDGADSASSDAL